MINDAVVKLNDEAEKFTGNKELLSPCYAHILSVLDDDLAGKIMQEKYTLSEMVRFIIAKAREALNGQNGALPDETVFGFAVEYYQSSREDIDKLVGKSGPATAKAATQKKEEKPSEKPVIKEVKKPVPKEKKEVQEQISMFDLMGGYANA